MSMSDLTQYREAQVTLKGLSQSIERGRDNVSDLISQRVEVMRELDEAGVSRATIAKWAGVDAMIVTRALRDE